MVKVVGLNQEIKRSNPTPKKQFPDRESNPGHSGESAKA